MKAETKAFAIIYLFLILYLAFGAFNYLDTGKINHNQDFDFHFKNAQGIQEHSYKELYNGLFQYFGFNQFVFYAINVFLIIVLIPFFLFLLNKNYWNVIIYFFGVSFAHQTIYGATFPSALIILFFLIYLNNRWNWFLLMILTGLSYYTHSKGIYLFLAIWIAELLYIVVLPKILPKLKQNLADVKRFAPVVFMQQMNMNTWQNSLWLFFINAPLPMLYFGLRKMRDFFLWFMISVSILGAIFIDYRTICILQIILCYSVGEQVPKLSKKIKVGLCIYLLLQLGFYLLDYLGGTRSLLFSV